MPQDHWLPGFNFNVEEWDAQGQTYERLANCRWPARAQNIQIVLLPAAKIVGSVAGGNAGGEAHFAGGELISAGLENCGGVFVGGASCAFKPRWDWSPNRDCFCFWPPASYLPAHRLARQLFDTVYVLCTATWVAALAGFELSSG
jgi:hypothetical protein